LIFDHHSHERHLSLRFSKETNATPRRGRGGDDVKEEMKDVKKEEVKDVEDVREWMTTCP
jgi:hypothetical protein